MGLKGLTTGEDYKRRPCIHQYVLVFNTTFYRAEIFVSENSHISGIHNHISKAGEQISTENTHKHM